MCRFYVDGDEVEVQDLLFYIEIKELAELKNDLEIIIADYA